MLFRSCTSVASTVNGLNSDTPIYPMLMLRKSDMKFLRPIADNVKTSTVQIVLLSVESHSDHHVHDDRAMSVDPLPALGGGLPDHFQLARGYAVLELVLKCDSDALYRGRALSLLP